MTTSVRGAVRPEVEAALLLLSKLGVTPEDLALGAAGGGRPVPSFAEFVPQVAAATSVGTLKAYGTYWNRVVEQWGSRSLTEPTPLEIEQFGKRLRAARVIRRNGRTGAGAGCGWYTEVQHADDIITRYCHMLNRPPVEVGQHIETGQVLGYVGSSGHSSGPHLHFEVHMRRDRSDAGAVDPVELPPVSRTPELRRHWSPREEFGCPHHTRRSSVSARSSWPGHAARRFGRSPRISASASPACGTGWPRPTPTRAAARA